MFTFYNSINTFSAFVTDLSHIEVISFSKLRLLQLLTNKVRQSFNDLVLVMLVRSETLCRYVYINLFMDQ